MFFFKNKSKLLFEFHCGLERETLRITKTGKLSRRSHPSALGSPLTHPYFGTDFGEAQLEWNTPPLLSLSRAEFFLKNLMAYTMEVNPQELFWPYSMPCVLPKEIEIARYGSSHEGQQKEVYRKGLKYRYGTNLQMISSLHFNFSFGSPLWDFLYDQKKRKENKQDFINQNYFKVIRNFLCEGWILTYLFGASPAMDQTYLGKIPNGFKKHKTTLYHPHATSIRMSYLGYYSRIQNQLTISFESLKNYLKDMEFALTTPCPAYQKNPVQLNDHYLQIPNEHYARIRPKRRIHQGETVLGALKSRGVEYVEVRSIDLDPFQPLGINKEQLLFLHQFLLYCLFKESTGITDETRCCLIGNQQQVALEGRKQGLLLKRSKPVPMRTWAEDILNKMESIAESLDGKDSNRYTRNIDLQKDKLKRPELTPSARILEALKTQSLEEFGVKWATTHQKSFKTVSQKKRKHFEETVETSTRQRQALETASKVLLEGHEELELSTQILMKEALSQGITVDVLDTKDNILRLKKGKHVEYVKQATKTSKDPYIIPHLMENKEVTKLILQDKGFAVPSGKAYHSLEEARNDAPLYQKKKIVVKPKSTNFGIGISFIQKGKGYLTALEEAFLHGNTILIEDFIPGKEYRFLVIGNRVEGIVHRVPAHVIGDGIHTIKELVHLKNHDPSFYRTPKTHLHLTEVEKNMLQKQRLRQSSIPKKGKTVFLRENSNVSTGGDAIDVTDKVHLSYHQIAAKAAKALGAAVCGVDIMISSPQKAATQTNHAIIELNYNPVLFFHAFPNQGKERNVARPLLKLLGF